MCEEKINLYHLAEWQTMNFTILHDILLILNDTNATNATNECTFFVLFSHK